MTSTAMYWMLNFLWLKHATLKTQDVIKKQQVSVYLQATVMLSDLGQACLGMVKHSVYVTFTAQKTDLCKKEFLGTHRFSRQKKISDETNGTACHYIMFEKIDIQTKNTYQN